MLLFSLIIVYGKQNFSENPNKRKSKKTYIHNNVLSDVFPTIKMNIIKLECFFSFLQGPISLCQAEQVLIFWGI